jgi:hypothetical protein
VAASRAECIKMINRKKPLPEQYDTFKLIRRVVRDYVRRCDLICDLFERIQFEQLTPDVVRELLAKHNVDEALVEKCRRWTYRLRAMED